MKLLGQERADILKFARFVQKKCAQLRIAKNKRLLSKT